MITFIIDILLKFIVGFINLTSYGGVFFLMLVESCGIPMPSEITMPFAGFLVAKGSLNFWGVVLAGIIGNMIGSVIAYYIGLYGGRKLIEKYGKYFLVSTHDLTKAEIWFKKYGEIAVLVGRLLPVVRTYISFPAGMAKMNFKKFLLYTLIGVTPWCVLFTWLGVKMQNNWEVIHDTFSRFDLIIVLIIILLIGLFLRKKIFKKVKS